MPSNHQPLTAFRTDPGFLRIRPVAYTISLMPRARFLNLPDSHLSTKLPGWPVA
jgi:hypothetical protein